MHLQTVTYCASAGWSAALPVELDSPRTLVLAFAGAGFGADGAPFRALAEGFPRSLMAGCSTAGEIAGAQVHDDSISVAVACFEHTDLRHAGTTIRSADDSLDAGSRLAAQLAGNGLRAVFVLSDGLRVNGSLLVQGLASRLPGDVIITGGLAGDGSRFQRTWVLDGSRPEANRVCAIGLYGERLRVGHGREGGWSGFGPERRITRAEGNVLFELDGKPALDLYRTYLGELAGGLPGTGLLFPLAVKRSGEDPDTLVRTILGIDEAENALVFAGDLPLRGVARLMRANTDTLIDSAGHAARAAVAGASAGALMISVSCVGRRLVLGERTDEEVETVSDSAPARSGHVGFYSYGEIAPTLPGRASELHNQTMTVTVFDER